MRLMTAADVDEVLSIEISVQSYPWTRGNFCDARASDYLCYVEEIEGKISAYAVLLPGIDEAELLSIGVAAVQQRKGLGRMMLQKMLAIAGERQLTPVFLEVCAVNLAALALYRSTGFLEVGRRRGYYRNLEGNEDAVVMACDVTGMQNG